jgi:hypothetical protein
MDYEDFIGADYEQMPAIGADFEQMPSLNNFDFGDLGNVLQGQDLTSFLDSLNIDLGSKSDLSSSMDMNQELLNSLGLGDLASESKISNAGDFGGTDLENLIRGQSGDPLDFGGTAVENLTKGQDPLDFGGTSAENLAKGTTTDAKGNTYTTDSKGNVYKNGTLYRAADEVIKPEDDPYKKISTGDVNGPIVPPKVTTPTTVPKVATPAGTAATDKSGMNPMMMMLMLYLLSQAGKSGSSTPQAVIPALQANRTQLPYSAPSRPGAGGQTYFSPTTYTPKMAGGGMATGGISTLGGYSDGGRLLRGPGDGVSDSIPATIGGNQKAALADGEFVVPARIVSELGNGSTEAGARKLYAMMDRVQQARRKTKNVAADTHTAKHLPA